MKILVAPNAFKGALSAGRAAECIARGLRRSGLDCQVEVMPIADGGDDTLEALVAAGGQVRMVQVQDPLGRPIEAELGLLADGQTAVVEMARASGLKLLRPEERDPMRTSTFGTGQLIAAAVDQGARSVIVGVGGSATVDGGSGCATALGVKLLDKDGRPVPPGGGGLGLVRRIDAGGLHPGLDRVKILVACDVDNPTLGPRGAAAIFGPQKGASPEQVKELEAGLSHFYGLVAESLGVDVRQTPRAGAAGALAAGLRAFFGAELRSGIELVLERLDCRRRLQGIDLVVTGEGRVDSQTLGDKGPIGLAREAGKQGVPVIALAGGIGDGEDELAAAGLEAVLSIVPGPLSLEEAMAGAAELAEKAGVRLGRLLRLGSRLS